MLQNADLSPLNLPTTPYFFHPLLSSFRHALSVKRGPTSIDCIAFDSRWNFKGGWTSLYICVILIFVKHHMNMRIYYFEKYLFMYLWFLFFFYCRKCRWKEIRIINSLFFYICLKSKILWINIKILKNIFITNK